MRRFWIMAMIFCFCSVSAWAQTDCGGEGQIEGMVLDKDGRPLGSAKVSILSEECVVTGIEPIAMTNDQGYFLLSHVPAGVSGVYAQKPEAGYPDSTAAIYLDDSALPPKVVVRSGETVSGVVVRLGKKAGLVLGEVVDAESLQPVVTARIRISLPDNDRIMLSMGPDAAGRFQLLLPARPVKFTVNAPGYEPWQFTGSAKSPGVIRLEPEAKTELSIKLRRRVAQATPRS